MDGDEVTTFGESCTLVDGEVCKITVPCSLDVTVIRGKSLFSAGEAGVSVDSLICSVRDEEKNSKLQSDHHVFSTDKSQEKHIHLEAKGHHSKITLYQL